MKIFSAANLGPRVQVVFPPGEGRTKQSMRDECDVNKIMEKFTKTGAVEHSNKFAGEYGFATSESYHDCMNVLSKANSMFAELPGAVRARMYNDPAYFLDFVQDEANADEMLELGLRIDAVVPPAGSPPAEPELPPAGDIVAPATSEAVVAAAEASD